jgi:hypothetical protein
VTAKLIKLYLAFASDVLLRKTTGGAHFNLDVMHGLGLRISSISDRTESVQGAVATGFRPLSRSNDLTKSGRSASGTDPSLSKDFSLTLSFQWYIRPLLSINPPV